MWGIWAGISIIPILTVEKGQTSNLEINGNKNLIPYVITTIDSGILNITMTSDTPVNAGEFIKLKINPDKIANIAAAGTSLCILITIHLS